MKSLIILSLLLGVLLQSCVIAINENNYSLLSEHDREQIPSFSLENWDRRVDHSKKLDICEINSRDIQALAKKHSYLWVHKWDPFCSNDHCQNISYLETMANKYADKDLTLVLVSMTYDIKSIQKIASTSQFTRPIAIMENDYYGKKMKAATRKFEYDLTNVSLEELDDKYRVTPDDFIFKDGVLLAAIDELNTQQLDSLIVNAKL